jgi:uncharacterized protein (TIGR02231 family)
MKIGLLIIILIANQAFAQSSKETELKTSIEDVTVFLKGAQITRVGKVAINSGRSIIIVKALSPYINEGSIQVKATGPFTILSVNRKMNYLNELIRDAKTDSLNKIMEGVRRQIAEKKSRMEVLKEMQSLLNVNKKLGGEAEGSTIAELKEAINFYNKELTRIKSEEINIGHETDSLNKELNKLQKQLGQIRTQSGKPASEIEISVDAKATTKGNFTLSYLVANAGWYPKYDLRVTDVSTPLELTYKAEVYQNTGVDWNKINLRFSNGNPNQSGVAPILSAWYLNYPRNFVRPQKKYVQSGAAQSKARVAQAEPLAFDEEISELSEIVQTNNLASPIENQTTVEFVVDIPYTIKSNGENLSVQLVSHKMETNYEYYAVPKLDKDAFLIARIINWDQYNLLQGEANLYFEDAFVGKTILNAMALSDTLDISLGRDKNIVIGREKVANFSKRVTLGSNKVESRGFNIIARNKKSAPVKLTLFDQIPLSAMSDITVEAVELSKGKLDERTGQVTWELELPPQKQIEIEFQYKVKYPKREHLVLE